MNEKTIRGEVHLVAMICLMHLTWKTCRQPSLTQGSEPKPLIQQMVQYESSSVSSSKSRGSFSLPAAMASCLAFATHSAFRHGKQNCYLKLKKRLRRQAFLLTEEASAWMPTSMRLIAILADHVLALLAQANIVERTAFFFLLLFTLINQLIAAESALFRI